MSDHEDPEDRKQEVLQAVLKFFGITVVVGLLIWLGTTVVVNSLGLDEVETGPVTNSEPFAPRSSLPTVALPSGAPTPSPTPTEEPTQEPTLLPTETPDPTSEGEDGLVLNASPLFVEPGKRIDLIGNWPGRDNVSLHVQRFEDGEWSDFGVQTQVKVGSYATYILTNREGAQRFRMFDPNTGTASNEVTITIGDD